MEYRTLSNYWLFDQTLRYAVHNRAQAAFQKLVVKKRKYEEELGMRMGMPLAQYIINTNNVDMARDACNKLGLNYYSPNGGDDGG
jgi:hypothetical protein